MLNLTEYRAKADRLADFLPWAALVADGVVLNKDGSFQRTAHFRGPDLDSAVPAELVAVSARLNNALRRLGSGWAVFFEAQRNPALGYPVNALRAALPSEVRVGTVDKFQGQEAAVCLVSLTASSAADAPRGLDFLLSLNRINVAISRAKGLALVFGAQRLRETKCDSIEQMKLVNVICALS
jgi:type IV secretory pathway VirB4 component